MGAVDAGGAGGAMRGSGARFFFLAGSGARRGASWESGDAPAHTLSPHPESWKGPPACEPRQQCDTALPVLTGPRARVRRVPRHGWPQRCSTCGARPPPCRGLSLELRGVAEMGRFELPRGFHPNLLSREAH